MAEYRARRPSPMAAVLPRSRPSYLLCLSSTLSRFYIFHPSFRRSWVNHAERGVDALLRQGRALPRNGRVWAIPAVEAQALHSGATCRTDDLLPASRRVSQSWRWPCAASAGAAASAAPDRWRPARPPGARFRQRRGARERERVGERREKGAAPGRTTTQRQEVCPIAPGLRYANAMRALGGGPLKCV
jgi:hypothetical protein